MDSQDIPHQDYFHIYFEKQVKDFIDMYDSSDTEACIYNIEMLNILNGNIVVSVVVNAVK